jgi:methylglutaconyl-CoA hydratase
MSTSKLTLDVNRRGVATLTLSRPDKGNALDGEMLTHMAATLGRINDDPQVRVLVLRGAGRHFCTGADVAEIKTHDDVAPDTGRVSIATVCTVLNLCAKPTVAVVHGACLGGGLAIAACCDAVIATPDAFFAIPEVRLGFAPTLLMPFFLAACGPRFLRRYLLSGERFDAKRAAQIGLVHAVRDPAELDAALADLVESFLLAGPTAVSSAKSALLAVGAATEAMPARADADAGPKRQAMIDEAQEGAASFREKRRPTWYPPASP